MLSRLPRVSTPLRLGETHTSLQFPLSVLRNSVQSEARTGTPADMLVDGKKPQKLTGVTQEQMSRMEREMANLQGPYKLVEQTYAEDVLNLVLARGYLAKLLDNKSVVRFIKQRRPEVLEQFEVIVETTSLDQ
jgi:hypothetical protein